MIDTLLKPEQRNSKFLKSELAHWLYWQLKYTIICDEYQYADIFAVKRNGYTSEFEIKVSKSDFDREMRIIKTKPEDVVKWGKDWQKWQKHWRYLGNERTRDMMGMAEQTLFDHGICPNIDDERYYPNEFWFYVPDYLAEHALKECQGLPYGVVMLGKSRQYTRGQYYRQYEVVKKADKLHKEKAPEKLYCGLAHALTIRSRLFAQPSEASE